MSGLGTSGGRFAPMGTVRPELSGLERGAVTGLPQLPQLREQSTVTTSTAEVGVRLTQHQRAFLYSLKERELGRAERDRTNATRHLAQAVSIAETQVEPHLNLNASILDGISSKYKGKREWTDEQLNKDRQQRAAVLDHRGSQLEGRLILLTQARREFKDLFANGKELSNEGLERSPAFMNYLYANQKRISEQLGDQLIITKEGFRYAFTVIPPDFEPRLKPAIKKMLTDDFRDLKLDQTTLGKDRRALKRELKGEREQRYDVVESERTFEESIVRGSRPDQKLLGMRASLALRERAADQIYSDRVDDLSFAQRRVKEEVRERNRARVVRVEMRGREEVKIGVVSIHPSDAEREIRELFAQRLAEASARTPHQRQKDKEQL